MKALSELGISPAPWNIRTGFEEWNSNDIKGIVDKNDESVVETYFGTIDSNFNLDIEGVANARLIAAAPEMYELLRGVYNYLSIDIDMNHDAIDLVKNIKDVLEKAIGESEEDK